MNLETLSLNDLSLKELKDLNNQIQKAIHSYEERKRKEALADLEDRARSMGFSLAELTGIPSLMKSRAPAELKYADPANPNVKWSGRGRKPLWFQAALDAGKAPDDMLIK